MSACNLLCAGGINTQSVSDFPPARCHAPRRAPGARRIIYLVTLDSVYMKPFVSARCISAL